MSQLWCGVLLCAYSSIPKIRRSLQKRLDSKVKSGFMSAHISEGLSTEALMNAIIDINTERAQIECLKKLVERAFAKLDAADAEYLKLRYGRGLSSERIAEISEVSLRTVYRRRLRALENLQTAFATCGYVSDEALAEAFQDNPYVRAIIEKLSGECVK